MSSQRNRARGCYKRTITLIENFVNSLTPDSIIDVNKLIIRESLSVKTFDDYDTVQKEIEVSIDGNDDDQISLQFEDRQAIVNRYVSLHSKIKTLIQKHYMDSANNGTHAHHSGILGMNSQPSPPAVKVKLPNLNIPTFDGNYGEWRTFIDLFTASVHNDNLLAKSQKFVYLKSFLKGEPLSLIRELNISDDNYSKALDLLKTQYDKKMPAINYHIVGLLEATLIKGLNGLRDFNSLIRQHINALEALGKHNTLLHENKTTHISQEQRFNEEGPHQYQSHSQMQGSTNSQTQRPHFQRPIQSQHLTSTQESPQVQTLTCTQTEKDQQYCMISSTRNQVLLATARVILFSENGQRIEVRALLDSASQTTFVTRDTIKMLKAKILKVDLKVSGISQSGTHVSEMVDLI
ncbi:hypothetical protein JTB14_017401 [Gonioctena quinquepunctata]|nr:hypothetical protein JTB14_017401 [Gonioctena quinquepunctata]